MRLVAILAMGAGALMLILYHEIERGADWLEEHVGVRQMVSLQMQADRFAAVGLTIFVFGVIVWMMRGR